MLPTINEKSFLHCDEGDLRLIIDNPDFRENEYLDYKERFSINEYAKDQAVKRQKAISEFRSDICAFANTFGGYLIFGVREEKGVPKELVGIRIEDNDTDKFELSIKNWLQSIQPRVPNVTTGFIKLNNNAYVVIVFVQRDYFAPYIHLENEMDYRIYKRVMNSKAVIAYSELKNMFSQSVTLEKEIEKFRKERIDYYCSRKFVGNQAQFVLLHIIPDTFLDSSYNKPMFVFDYKGISFSDIFRSFNCDSYAQPIIEGLKYTDYQSENECRLYNNGIAECFSPIQHHLTNKPEGYPAAALRHGYILKNVADTMKRYIQGIHKYLDTLRVFICISIKGCQGLITYYNDFEEIKSIIDRDELLCQPVVFDDITNNATTDKDMKRMQLEYYLALGISHGKDVKSLIEEVYGQ